MNRKWLHPTVMFAFGLLLGAVSRLLDLYTQNLGEIFSQMAIWILLGTLLSIYSKTPKRAAGNVFFFCVGMLLAYYTVAVLTHGVYGTPFIIGWSLFALCTPVLAALAWKSKEKGVFPAVIRVGIAAVSVLSSVLLFDGFRIYDLVINGILVFFLFFKRVPGRSVRSLSRRRPLSRNGVSRAKTGGPK